MIHKLNAADLMQRTSRIEIEVKELCTQGSSRLRSISAMRVWLSVMEVVLTNCGAVKISRSDSNSERILESIEYRQPSLAGSDAGRCGSCGARLAGWAGAGNDRHRRA